MWPAIVRVIIAKASRWSNPGAGAVYSVRRVPSGASSSS